ncbi:hypothetical protein BDD14_2862 [Edaphobacter modestus]|uniref:Uncharacterized protein n=1 Tax=Edaphobacter modestus TaxID=388466 RepID=A0A4Q7YW93_9BACT|nr:hypothetical protein BDD14_2862 [Edaphobacter modestus]
MNQPLEIDYRTQIASNSYTDNQLKPRAKQEHRN